MLHPSTENKFINSEIGYGVFATDFIPKGTIVYVKDSLEIEVTPVEYAEMDLKVASIVDKYSYIDEKGIRILSWDMAKYVNHSCQCNTMSTGFGFEIAIRDIAKGEEITDEYGLFNIEEEFLLSCNCCNCRKMLRPTDIDSYYSVWDDLIIDAFKSTKKVAQPLWKFIDKKTEKHLTKYLNSGKHYPSVLTLKYIKDNVVEKVPAVDYEYFSLNEYMPTATVVA